MFNDYLLVKTSVGLELQSKNHPEFKPLLIDFVHSKVRLQKGQSIYSEHIIRACGIKPTYKPYIIDATAGLGQDAYVLASSGCKVLMLERSPYLAALLEDALLRLKDFLPYIDLHLHQVNAINFLTQLAEEEKPEIIYLDPMFESRTKAALVKKEMRIIRDLVGEDLDADELLQVALQCAKKRVVVKRHRHAPALLQRTPDFKIEGRVGRFDVYCIIT